MVDNVLYVQASAQALVFIQCPHVSYCLSDQGLGRCIGLPAMQPEACLSGSCVGREGHVPLVYKYTWSTGNCAACCNIPVASSCHSLVDFKPFNNKQG